MYRVPGFTRVSEFLGSHTCIRVPGFSRVSEFLGSHVYPSSWVHIRVSEFKGSHVYQSSWVYTCIKITRFTCVSEFLASHVYQSSWVHTCIRVPGFTHVYHSSRVHMCIRVPGFTHVCQSSRVLTCIRVSGFILVSKLLGSHVYQSSWVHARVSDFLRSHRFRTNVLKLVHIPVKRPLKPLRPSVWPNVTTPGFSRNLIMENFTKNCPSMPVLVKTEP